MERTSVMFMGVLWSNSDFRNGLARTRPISFEWLRDTGKALRDHSFIPDDK
jgi:hypothetical protein